MKLNKVLFKSRLLLSFSLLAVLCGCAAISKDNSKLAAAVQLSNDGKAATDAYVAYMTNAISAINARCDLQNFSTMLAFRKGALPLPKDSIGNYLPFQDCTKVNGAKNLSVYQQMIADATAAGKVYSALLSLTTAADAQAVQTSASSLESNIATASKIKVSADFSAISNEVIGLAVNHVNARGIENFAAIMSKIPATLAGRLSNSDVASSLDNEFASYNNDLKIAIRDAYRFQAIDIAPDISKFYSSINIKMPANLKVNDDYFEAFAVNMNRGTIVDSAAKSRLDLIDLMQKLKIETDNIGAIDAKSLSIKDDIAAIKMVQQSISGYLHSPSAETVSK